MGWNPQPAPRTFCRSAPAAFAGRLVGAGDRNGIYRTVQRWAEALRDVTFGLYVTLDSLGKLFSPQLPLPEREELLLLSL